MEPNSETQIVTMRKKRKKHHEVLQKHPNMEPESETLIETKKKKRKRQHEEIQVLDEQPDMEPDDETQIEMKKKKKKKRKKHHEVLHENPDMEPNSGAQIETEEEKRDELRAEIQVIHDDLEMEPDSETLIETEEEKRYELPAEIHVIHDDPDMEPDSETLIETEEEKIEELHAKIQVIHEDPDKTAPIVGYFPSGFDPNKDNASPQHEPPRVRVFRNMGRRNRLQLVVSPNGSKVDFVGTSYLGEAETAQVCTYALGVLDKETQTLKIVPIASNKIFRLEPRVGGLDYYDKEQSSSLKEEQTAESKESRIRELTQLYGTKKSITTANKMDSLKQKVDPNSQEDLDRKMKKVVINKEALETSAAPSARNIPPYDSSATTPEQAYPLDKIIFKGEWDYLLDIRELLHVGAEVALDSYPNFVCNRIHKLGEIQDEMKKQQLACIFSYITHLIKFKDQHSMDRSSSAKLHKIPKILRQKFSTMFAESESKRLSDEKNALLVSYVLVLTLFADGFLTDPSDIARDLRMSPVNLRAHYEHLGCKFKHENKLLMATLPVPLQFPKLRQRRRR